MRSNILKGNAPRRVVFAIGEKLQTSGKTNNMRKCVPKTLSTDIKKFLEKTSAKGLKTVEGLP